MNTLPETLPKCPTHSSTMQHRSSQYQTTEQLWCGVWFDCTGPGCSCSTLYPSHELKQVYRKAGKIV